MSRVGRASSGWRLLAGALLCLVWAWPVWVAEWPPLIDFPVHVLQASVLQQMGFVDPGPGGAVVISWNRPHLAFEVLTGLLCTVAPPIVAGKLVLSALLVGIAGGCLALVRRAGRPDWYVLVGASASWGFPTYWGLLGNLGGYALVVGGAALADALLARPSRRGWLVLSACGLAFFPFHLLMFCAWVAALCWLALLRERRPTALVRPLLTCLPGGALIALHTATVGRFHSAAEEGATALESAGATPLGRKLMALPSVAFGAHPEQGEALVGALLLLFLAALALDRRWARVDWRERLFRTRFLSLGGWWLLLYLVLPQRVSTVSLLDQRFVPLALLCGVAGLPRPAGPVRRRVALLLAAGIAVLQLGNTCRAARVWDGELRPLRALLARAEPGRRLLGLIQAPGSAALLHPPLHIHDDVYYQLLRGGRVGLTSMEFRRSMVRWRDPNPPEVVEATRAWAGVRDFSFARHGASFDYFLIRADPAQQPALLERWFGPHLSELTARGQGPWLLLYRRE